MIERYFAQQEAILCHFPNIHCYSLKKKTYNAKQGFISDSIIFETGYRLDFVEVKNTDEQGKIKYRYQYMDENLVMIFRYDNAPHHQNTKTFPHHKHLKNKIQESVEPDLFNILLECSR